MSETPETNNVLFRVDAATEGQVYNHLKGCNNDFIPPLETKVDIAQYSSKIRLNATTFEAWYDAYLIGLVAVYFNDKNTSTAFVTSVSVFNSFKGKGIAATLISNCIEYAISQNFYEIKLEVNESNNQAINLYKKFNFAFQSNNDGIVRMTLKLNKN